MAWWNKTLAVIPVSREDAHRPLGQEHSLAASLSYVDNRQVSSDYTIRFDDRIYQIARQDIRAGLRGSGVRVEVRLDASFLVRFGSQHLEVAECEPRRYGTASESRNLISYLYKLSYNQAIALIDKHYKDHPEKWSNLSSGANRYSKR